MNVVTVEIAKLSVRQGDLVVLTLPGQVENQVRAAASKMLAELVPPGVNTVVLDGGATLSVVRPEEVAEGAGQELGPAAAHPALILPPDGLSDAGQFQAYQRELQGKVAAAFGGGAA